MSSWQPPGGLGGGGLGGRGPGHPRRPGDSDSARHSTSIAGPLEHETERNISTGVARESGGSARPGVFPGAPPVGGADLDPFGRRPGGGMIMDPRDLHPRVPDSSPDPENPFPGRVPGARFDPFGPPELGPQFGQPGQPPRRGGPGGRGGRGGSGAFGPGGLGFGAGPNPDHFQPPPDMFM